MKTTVFCALALMVWLAGVVGAADSPASPSKPAKATFAGGCFWCMEHDFDQVDGVVSTTSGYTGGHTKNPAYEEVSQGGTGHAESVEVVYDPSKVSYEKLLEVYWHNVDPITPNAQFCDHGTQYRTAIFYHDEGQKRLAEASKQALEKSGRLKQPIVTQIIGASDFYPAEEYHQDYAEKNPLRYRYYRFGCGRDQRLRELWGDLAGHEAVPAASPKP
jgi:peptide-methionine (S)-S-oxide reductase